MAALVAEPSPAQKWTTRETRAQFAAIARLRWRILINGFRRKGGMGDLLANIVIAPLALLFIVGPAVGAAAVAWLAMDNHHPTYLSAVMWGIFFLSQFANIQLGQPGTTFDPTQLIRFPLTFRGYFAVRLFFGLISPANITSTMMSLGVAVGITIATPWLWPVAFLALGAFALANVAFTRMLFAWVDRWLATRRTREIFTIFIFAGSIGIQWANVTFNPGFHHSTHDRAVSTARLAAARTNYHHIKPLLDLLPPGLAVRALNAANEYRYAATAGCIAGILAFATVFFVVFAMRLKKEFRGETLSEIASAVSKPRTSNIHAAAPAQAHTASDALLQAPVATHRLSPGAAIAAVFHKELLTLRRNTGLFFGLIAPLAMLLIFAGRFSGNSGHMPSGVMFACAVAYVLLGVVPLSYNSFGMEGAGVQFYFLAPVSMRSVFLAKNIFNVLLALVEIAAVFGVITFIRRAPSPQMTLSVVFWSAFTLLVSMAIGNRRSITAPKRIDPQRPAGKQASALSALIAMGVLLLSAGVAFGIYLLAEMFQARWILLAASFLLAAIGFSIYAASLNSLDKLLSKHREGLIETLVKSV